MKELKLEELSTRQKLGIVMSSMVSAANPESVEYAINMIRNHSLGAIWVNYGVRGRDEVLAKIREAADYPILVMTDAESGICNYRIGKHNPLGCTDNEELAYTFGKVTGVTAKRLGYNTICNPVLDIVDGNYLCGMTIRSLGSDKYKVAKLAKAMTQGLHDSGILTVAKHYPGSTESDLKIDSHMGEATSEMTREQMIENNLYPYIELIKEGLLDGIMTKHARFVNIDPDYPASLSKKMIGIIRELGFDGFTITDALTMMGVVAKFGRQNSIGLAIANGNDLALPYYGKPKMEYEFLCNCYDEGLIPDDRLDEAVSRVLAAQHKTLTPPKHTVLDKQDINDFNRISPESIFTYIDEGVSATLDKEGRHLFTILTETPVDIRTRDQVQVDTLDKDWYRAASMADKIQTYYPNSGFTTLSVYPGGSEVHKYLDLTVEYDDVVFITFFNSTAYIGRECLSSRVISVMDALQVSGRISTVIHLGNPYILEDLPHIPRIIVGNTSSDSLDHCLEILAGNAPALGIPTYDIKLK